MLLSIRNLKAKVIEDDKEILKGVNLTINPGEIHVLMGPNGSGKSTLSNVIMGSPKFEVTDGEVLFEGKDILNLDTNERAKLGIFLTFQHPQEIEGVKMRQFLINAYRHMHPDEKVSPIELNKRLNKLCEEINLSPSFLERYVNSGFSGGEKKKSEILQLFFLKPKLVIIDEIDSGLDVDALRDVAEAINKLKTEDMSILMITHYQRILKYLHPDFVHVYVNGRIVHTGDASLAEEIEEKGYSILNEFVDADTVKGW
ncbi:ABC transporter ATP-binding protein [Marinitoga sp. 1135]|uniref:Fe-S cluster assembly ATPase SufC n=1 Tax=unclassified Marinitoga TaxID=2640159 RepID=UPI0009509C17|nr:MULTISPECIES: Fe-S cluster assembly ATPase SufC [unclassified Marinitoga]APT76154.1 ABC transporter ATP-binding protein [Marinitoga sp. 1137]NUU95906.1 ABC transporter ATP-binding protein [Marinitoga sp. 1135]NUU97817.1 ABC transporter ATP-binding protein [Marinitoga sp. 1138]